MTYALIVGGAVATYPYSIARLRQDNPQTSFPAAMADDVLASLGVYPVTAAAPPTPSQSENVVEGVPVFSNGVWTQVWTLVAASAQEVAARQAEAARIAALTAAQGDAFVQSFLAMTPAQADTYVLNNTGTLAETRALLRRMALMLLALAKRGFEE